MAEYKPQGRTALYRLYDKHDRLLYVGVTSCPQTRFRSHSHNDWWPSVATREIVWMPTRNDAEYEETHAIRTEYPVHNRAPGSAKALGERRDGKGWKPSPQTKALLSAYQRAADGLAKVREVLEADAVREVRSGVKPETLSRYYPWSQTTIRKLGAQAPPASYGAALDLGLLTHDEVYGPADPVRPQSSEETTA